MPDPGRITGLQDFGRELSLARQQAGLTIREVARASGIPASTVGDYFAGRHLPPVRQPELLTRVLAACGITTTEQADRWQEALNRIRRMPGRPSARGRAPYRGLASFQPEDAAWFFGRDHLVLHLVRLATGPDTPGLPLAVVGPSGSGKSSLLRAGLVPRLRTATPARPGGRPVALITPGASPVDALARGLASLAGPGFGGLSAERLARGIRENPERYARLAGRGDEPPAIIVDQLEEIFTAGAGGTGRQEFVAALAAARQGAHRAGQHRILGGVQSPGPLARGGQRGPRRPAVGHQRPGPAAPHRAGAHRAVRVCVLGRVRPRRTSACRREHRRQRVAMELGRSRPSGTDRHVDRPGRARVLGRFRPRRAHRGRGGLLRPGLAVEHPGRGRGRGVCAVAGQPLARDEWHVYVPGLPYAPPCR